VSTEACSQGASRGESKVESLVLCIKNKTSLAYDKFN
jgi:hypothetical protein